MWHVDRTADADGTSLLEEAEVVPAFLVSRFGPPSLGDGYRVTGYYVFTDSHGQVFTVYDFKSTAAYLGEEDCALSPIEFWKSEFMHELSIGGLGTYGDGSAKGFIAWLLDEQSAWKSDRPDLGFPA